MNDWKNTFNLKLVQYIKIKLTRLICFLLLLAFLSAILCSCWDKKEIDDLAYVVAIGFDKGKEKNSLRITLQIARPDVINGGGGESSGKVGGGGGSGDPFIVTTIQAPTLYSAFNMVNTYISREINVSTNIALIFSKDLAQDGIRYLLNAIQRGRQFRTSMYVVVSRTTAEEYINAVKPVLEKNPAKYYQLNYSGYRYTSFTANTQLYYFAKNMSSPDRQAVAILAGVSKHKSVNDVSASESTYSEKGRITPFEGDYLAGNLPRAQGAPAETMGLAVFDGDKMVGELDGEDTSFYLMITGEYRNAFWTFNDPKEKGRYIVLNIRQSRRPKYKVSFNGNKPMITVKLLLEADITSIQSGINYERDVNMRILEEYIKDYLQKSTIKLLRKTTSEYHSDIFGFGSCIKTRFSTWQDFENFRWKQKYKNSEFKVEIDFKIRRPGLLLKSSKAYNSMGEGGIQY